MSRRSKIIASSLAVLALVGLVVWGVASGGGSVDAGAANPGSAAVDYSKALAGAPPELAKLYANGDALIPGGVDELDRRLDSVRGHPAVVNAWASWCGPCRFEFPDLQKVSAARGDRVAFIGVDTDDSDQAARSFLDELPLPYPSVTDPQKQIFDEYKVRFGLPATGFYDRSGKLVFVKQGPYTSAEQLNADIDKYAN